MGKIFLIHSCSGYTVGLISRLSVFWASMRTFVISLNGTFPIMNTSMSLEALNVLFEKSRIWMQLRCVIQNAFILIEAHQPIHKFSVWDLRVHGKQGILCLLCKISVSTLSCQVICQVPIIWIIPCLYLWNLHESMKSVDEHNNAHQDGYTSIP